jgi:hypothetical protein
MMCHYLSWRGEGHYALEAKLHDLPNLLISPIPGCSAHILHRVMVHSSQETRMCGDLHATAYACTRPRHQALLVQAVRRIVGDEQWFEFNTDMMPDPRWTGHTEAVLRCFKERPFRCRGAVDCDGDAASLPRGAKSVEAEISKVLAFVNGDIRSEKMVHYERACGRCVDRASACDNFATALVEGGILLPSTATVPSKHRPSVSVLIELRCSHLFHNAFGYQG